MACHVGRHTQSRGRFQISDRSINSRLRPQETGLTDLLIWMRAIHFAATISVVGAVFFAAFVAEPAFRAADHEGEASALVRSRLGWITSISLLVVVISGAGW